jgi:hypothetical protein
MTAARARTSTHNEKLTVKSMGYIERAYVRFGGAREEAALRQTQLLAVSPGHAAVAVPHIGDHG